MSLILRLLVALPACVLPSVAAPRPGDPARLPDVLGTPFEIAIAFGALTLVPVLVMAATPFLRIVLVLHFLRQALGTQTAPSNQVLTGLALFLTFLAVEPVAMKVHSEAIAPYQQATIGWREAVDRATPPIRNYLLRFARERDLELMVGLTGKEAPPSSNALPLSVVVPAYTLSELRAGFQIGAVLFLPFLVIDLVVASMTLAVGMVQLPPVMISAPIKILLFVLVDGWNLIIGSLAKSVTG